MQKTVFLLPFLLASFFLTSNIHSQDSSPYHLSLKRELLYGGSGAAITLTSRLIHQNIKPITFGALTKTELLDIDEYEFFDEELVFTFSPKPAGNLSDLTLHATIALPALFLSHKRSRNDFGTIGLLYLETLLLNQGLTDIAKYTVLRPRPYVWTDVFSNNRLLTPNDRASFFSGHTSATAAASFFFARVFADYYPDSGLKPYVWSAAATLPVLTAYLRVKAGKHYPTDVLVGYVLGGAIGYLVPTLHKRPLGKRRISIATGLNAIQLSLQF